MFEIGEYVWVEYDGSEAFIGQIADLTEDEVSLNQVAEFKRHVSVTERLIRLCENAANSQSWVNARAQFLGMRGLAGVPSLLLGEKIVRTKLMYLLVEEAIDNGAGYLRALEVPMRVVLPRGGAVFKDARVAVNEVYGDTPEEEDTAAVDAEVEAFREVLDAFEGLDMDDVESPDVEPNNKPDF